MRVGPDDAKAMIQDATTVWKSHLCPQMKARLSRPFILFATALCGVVAFAGLSRQVKPHRTAHFDGRVRGKFPRRRRQVTKKLANLIGPLGKEWIHGPVAAVIALVLWKEGRRSGAAAVIASSALSAGLSHLFEATITPRKPPPGRHSPTEPSFPSGHSLETSAVSLTVAYVLAREGLADGRIAIPAALAVPAISGIGRLYLDRHWSTDVMAGWLAGVTVAAGCAAAYEATAD